MVMLKDIGEKEALMRIRNIVGRSRYLDFPDDAISIRFNEKFLVINIDGFSFKYSKYYWMDLYDLGWKAVAASISDIVAKGGKPIVTASSIGFRKNRSIKELRRVIKGLKNSSTYHGASYLGGDLNETPRDEWIDVLTIGISEKPPIPRKSRRHVRKGDIVLTWGNYGLTGVALHAHYNKVHLASWRKVLEKTKRPKVDLKVLEFIEEIRRYIRSSQDVSDGLAETLWELSKVNDIGFKITHIPVDEEAVEYAKSYGLNPIDLALYGGEEYNIVFVVAKEIEGKLSQLKRAYGKLNVLGEVISEKTVYVEIKGEKKQVGRGWEYFRNE